MHLYFSTPLESIPLDIELPFALYVRVGNNFVLFRKAGDTLTTERVQSLAEKTDALYVLRESLAKFLTYLESACNIYVDDSNQAAENLHALLVAYGRHLEQLKSLDLTTLNKMREFSLKLVELSNHSPEVQNRILKRYKDRFIYFSSHSTNVAVYAMAIGRKLKLGDPDLGLLSFACLVHNVGLSQMPIDLLYKRNSLSLEERTQLQSHPLCGSQLLKNLAVPEEIYLTARQHHECIDGSGYPYGLKGSHIHLFAKICTIADVYDALISHRPYGPPPLSPLGALQEMQHMTGKFDPKILNMMGNA